MRRAPAQVDPSRGLPRRLLLVLVAAASVLWRCVRVRRRIPIVYQLDSVECGTACLAMILAHLGHRHPLSAARRVCDPGRDGLSVGELTDAAHKLGLQVDAHRPPDKVEGLAAIPLPAIAHWRRNHFVVIERVRGDGLTIIDPARGRQNIATSDFKEGCGVLLTFTHGHAFAPAKDANEYEYASRGLPFLLGLIRIAGAWPTLLLLACYSLGLQLVGLITPWLTQLMVDRVIPARRITPLMWVGLAILAVVCSQALLRYVRAATLTHLQAVLDKALMTRFVSHLLDLPLRFFQQRSAGDLLMRLAGNSNVRELITGQSLAVVFDGLFVTGYLLLLLFWSPLFAGIALALGLVQATVLLSTRATLKDVTDRHLAAQADAHGTLVEALHGIGSLKTLGAEPFLMTRWSNLFRRQMDLSVRRQLLAGIFESGLTSLRLFSTLTFLWCGAHEVMLGHLTLGTMLGLNALAAGFLMPIGSLVGNLQQFHLVRTQLDRIFDVLDAPPEQVAPRAQGNTLKRRSIRLSGAITFDRVNFRYHASAPFVLTDVSFSIRSGQCVGIVGRTGSGKSTLAALLLGLHEPTHGTISIDGVPLPSLDYRALRRQCGVVFQDSLVFATSLRDNIAFGRPDVALDAIERAARLADIHNEIARLPMGYDTPLLDGGSGLSAGQRQRLLLARALVHEPALLVLDEATSHLDAEAEQRVIGMIQLLPCTRLLITHHLNTIRHADLVLVVDGGRVVKTGSPADLLAHDGLHATWTAHRRNGTGRDIDLGSTGSDRGFALTDRGG
jgi:ATP-binding cassette subfamily B protein